MKQSPALHRELLAKRVELVSRRDHVVADIHRRSGPLSSDFEEQAVERENDEVLERVREATQEEINNLDRALARLAVGSYGKCASCGKTIEKTRLEARPEADTCLACVSKLSAANQPVNGMSASRFH